jgi:selenide,water dikinase
MPLITDPNVLVGLSTSDDAAVYRISDDVAVVLTVDFFTPVVDDAYEFGRIAVTNALSDIYAMGAKPVLALNLVAYPARSRPLDMLEEILRGGSDQATAAGVSIAGGHSIDDPEPKYGMCVMGVVHPGKVLTNSGAKVGDKLFLTKPIGTGIITTAIKHDTAPAEVAAEAIRVMTTLNASASEAAVEVGCSACTDVTGFGLLGHLHEMTFASGVGARIRVRDVPLIDGVRELLALDEAPGGTYANRDHLNSENSVIWGGGISEEDQLALCDAQTAGGLLISVPADHADAMREALIEAQTLRAAEIGEIIEDSECRIRVEP